MSFRRFQGRSARPSQGRPMQGGRGKGRNKINYFSDITKFVNKIDALQVEPEYVAQHQFADFGFESALQKNIETRGYVTPSPIQDQSITYAMEGRDVIGLANTGTGKTAAFLLPLINKVLRNPHERVLILAPTRELAVQIDDEFRLFARGLQLFSVVCIGGASLNMQIQNLRRRHSFVIATPGRLKDLVQHRALSLGSFTNVVLDEVDQMFDMGFIKEVQLILSQLPKSRQSLFFSATMSAQIDALVKAEMNQPIVVSLKKRDTASSVDQDVIHVNDPGHKLDILHDLLIQEEFSKVLIFGRTKHGVQRLSRTLEERGFKSDAIHGDRSQNQRQHALNRFKRDQIQILVATDVAARGIDIPDVTHVINYELPETYDDYVHRIGRTGRANRLGKALTFMDGQSR